MFIHHPSLLAPAHLFPSISERPVVAFVGFFSWGGSEKPVNAPPGRHSLMAYVRELRSPDTPSCHAISMRLPMSTKPGCMVMASRT